MPKFRVTFEDGNEIEVDDAERYREDIVDSILTRRFERQRTAEGLPIIPISAISFYLIADEKKASAAGREQKQTAEQMTKFVLEGTLQYNKPPFVLVTTLNGGGHYQGLKIHFKDAKNLDIVLINSIAKSQNMSQGEAFKQAEDEIAIFRNIGFNINRLTYKEHYLQSKDNDCGPCTIANLEYELNHPNVDTKPTRLTETQNVIMRARQSYEFRFKKEPPAIRAINGKPYLHEATPVAAAASAKPAVPVATAVLAKETSLQEKIIEQCQEIMGATEQQARELAKYTLSKQERTFEDHIAFLTNEWSNSNLDLNLLIARISSAARPVLHQAKANASPPKQLLTATKTAASPKEQSIEDKIIVQCKEIMGATDIQAKQLAHCTLLKQERSFEDHVNYLVGEWMNSDNDVSKLVTRLSGASIKQKK